MTFKISESISLLKKAKNLDKNRGYVVMTFKVSESISLLKKAKKLGKNRWYVVRTFNVSESISLLKNAKNLGKHKIFLMAVYIIFKYSKRFRFAPSFNYSKEKIPHIFWPKFYASFLSTK